MKATYNTDLGTNHMREPCSLLANLGILNTSHI